MSKRENMFKQGGKVKGGLSEGGRLSTVKKDGSGSNGIGRDNSPRGSKMARGR